MSRFVLVCILISTLSGGQAAESVKDASLPPVEATAQSLMRFQGFMEPLQPIVDPANAVIEPELVTSIQSWSIRKETDDFSALEQFVEKYPQSAWTPALQYNLGRLNYATGYFSKAIDAYKAAWDSCKSIDHAFARNIAHQAAGELAMMYGRVGRKADLQGILEETKNMTIGDSSRVKLDLAADGLHMMNVAPGNSFRCGPFALRNVSEALGRPVPESFKAEAQSTEKGFSINELVEIASGKLSMPVTAIKLDKDATIPVPSVMHLRSGHYGAIVRESQGNYLLKDPTFGNDTWMTLKAVRTEGSGYFLVPADKVPAKYESVSTEDGAKILGKGATSSSDPNATSINDPNSKGDGGDGDGTSPSATPDQSLCPRKICPPGMAGYSFHLMRVSLIVADTPLLIPAPFGVGLGLTVRYNQREAYQPTTKLFTHFGPQWVNNTVSYLEDNPANLAAYIRVYLKDGGSEIHTGYTAINGTSGTFGRHYKSNRQLVRINTNKYELRYADGSKQVYEQAIGTVGPARKVFLSQIIDSWGNTVTFNYDGTLTSRLQTVTNNAGQSMYLFYENGSDSYLVTGAADGPVLATATRKAVFAYQLQADQTRLNSITDPVGIVSAFSYDRFGFLETLTTPYGVTRFATNRPSADFSLIHGMARWVQATDAFGDTERMEYRTDFYTSDKAVLNAMPKPTIPTNQVLPMSAYTTRNSLYWDKKAWQLDPGNVDNAHLYQWLADGSSGAYSGGTATGVLQKEKPTKGNFVHYFYPSVNPIYLTNEDIGSSSLPVYIARAIEGPTGTTVTQLQTNEYHALTGNLTRTVDPDGHEVKFNYDATGYDVLSVQFKDGANWITVMTASNYLNHRPQTVTDATGAVTNYTYNSKGQISQVITTAGTETLTSKAFFDLNSDGTADEAGFPLRSETNSASNPAVMVTTGSMTIDAAKRPRTVTDAQGYTVTYDYDALDRLTQVTHPDATTEQYVYVQDGKTLLHPTAVKDRAGRWSRVVYNALGQVIMSIDPALRTTLYQWCKCGSLSKLTDPMGKVTFWKRDIEGRVTNKFLSDGKEYRYTYQPLSGRLDTVAFPKDSLLNQTTYSQKYALSGQLVKTDYTDASLPDVTMAYADPLGRMSTMTDGLGTYTPTYYAFGIGGNSGKLSVMNGPLAHDRFTYAYDAMGRGVTSQLLKDDNSVLTSEAVTYDGMSRALTLINNLGTFTSTYGASNFTGTPDSVALPGGFSTVLTRFAANAGANALRLQTMDHRQGASTVKKHDYTYGLSGNITSWARTNATANVSSWTLLHDAVDQLSELEESLDGVSQKKESWHYDAAGNIASTMVKPTGQSGTLQIRTNTGRNQLTQMGGTGKTVVEGTTDEASTVTVNGQPAKATADSVTGPFRFYKEMDFAAGSNTISIEAKDGNNNTRTDNYSVTVSATADQTLEYDANGNTTKMRNSGGVVTRLMEWDAINQLKAVQSAEVLAAGVKRTEFSYDGMGRRIKQIEKEHNGTTWVTQSDWQYLWEGMSLAQKRDTATGTVLVSYFGSGEIQGTDALVYLPDHLGTVRDWYRVSDGLKGSADYSAYGVRTVTLTGPGLPERGYTGHLHHAASGLILAPFRVYDPETGRWPSEDPIGEQGGLNLYGYVGNSPIGATDPLGLEIFIPFNPDALGGIGHPAILAGNSEAGYQFRSFSAGKKRFFGGAEKDNLESKPFPTLELAMKFLKDQGFKEFAMWNSSPEQEQKAIEAIDKAYSSAAYDLGSADRTCAGMARKGIKASGVMQIHPDDSFSMHPTRFFALYSMFASKTGNIK